MVAIDGSFRKATAAQNLIQLNLPKQKPSFQGHHMHKTAAIQILCVFTSHGCSILLKPLSAPSSLAAINPYIHQSTYINRR
jgi:hypothetical protein